MIEFKPYQSKPITRMAFQLSDQHEWAKIEESTYFVSEKTTQTTNFMRFKAYEEPKIGDWIVRLTEDDTYHVSNEVFHERNIVY